MTSADYRIESSSPIASCLLPVSGAQQYFVSDRALAVTVAAKSTTRPGGQEIRVVHVEEYPASQDSQGSSAPGARRAA